MNWVKHPRMQNQNSCRANTAKIIIAIMNDLCIDIIAAPTKNAAMWIVLAQHHSQLTPSPGRGVLFPPLVSPMAVCQCSVPIEYGSALVSCDVVALTLHLFLLSIFLKYERERERESESFRSSQWSIFLLGARVPFCLHKIYAPKMSLIG